MPDATPHLLRAEAHILAAVDELDAAVAVLTSDPQSRPRAVDVQRRRHLLVEVFDTRRRRQRHGRHGTV